MNYRIYQILYFCWRNGLIENYASHFQSAHTISQRCPSAIWHRLARHDRRSMLFAQTYGIWSRKCSACVVIAAIRSFGNRSRVRYIIAMRGFLDNPSRFAAKKFQ